MIFTFDLDMKPEKKKHPAREESKQYQHALSAFLRFCGDIDVQQKSFDDS